MKISKLLKARKNIKQAPVGGHLVAFDERAPFLNDARCSEAQKHIISSPFRRKVWQEHLQELAETSMRETGLAWNNDIVVFILSSMDRAKSLHNPDSFPELFEETLAILAEELQDVPVVIKVHPATSKSMRARQIELVDRNPNKKVIFSNLHPDILAQHARCFIANTASSVFAHAKFYGIPTIEYSHYSAQSLDLTNGGSMNPGNVDHFINHDTADLRDLLNNLTPSPAKERGIVYNDEPAYDAVLDFLADSGPVANRDS